MQGRLLGKLAVYCTLAQDSLTCDTGLFVPKIRYNISSSVKHQAFSLCTEVRTASPAPALNLLAFLTFLTNLNIVLNIFMIY